MRPESGPDASDRILYYVHYVLWDDGCDHSVTSADVRLASDLMFRNAAQIGAFAATACGVYSVMIGPV